MGLLLISLFTRFVLYTGSQPTRPRKRILQQSWVDVADRENHRVQVFDDNGKFENAMAQRLPTLVAFCARRDVMPAGPPRVNLPPFLM
jgi:hypothetical protein